MHPLEKIVALVAVAAALALAAGFARAAADGPFLRSAVALVLDAHDGRVVLAKKTDAVLPIASITKLMTAMVLLDRGLDLGQRVAISSDDQDLLKGTRSRLKPGSTLTRDELLLVALMSSENRAAAALARTYPGGTEAFVAAMNAKAQQLGMEDSRFVDPTGLSPSNVSSARDLVKLVIAASSYPLIRDYSTRESAQLQVGGRAVGYRNTNGLVRSRNWDIGLQKTGYLNEAGRCLVMRVRLASRDLVVVLLDSWGKYSRVGDANRIRRWLESSAGERRG
jgi:D-alanyl-D-alanine endopeptidase (penicillin-binding protein 7)